MAEVLKSRTNPPGLITTLPGHEHFIGPDLTAGENIDPVDACYIAANGLVLRALENQTTGSAVNEVQTLTIPADTTDGVYALRYPAGPSGVSTVELAWNSNAAAIQAALVALSSVGASGFAVTGALPTFTITAGGGLAGKDVGMIEVDSSLIGSGTIAPVAYITVGTQGQPAGADAELAQGRVRGFSMIKVKRGQPITLYNQCAVGYSDQLLTPGADLFLSSTVPGGLATVATNTGQRPIAYAIDNTRVQLAVTV